MKSEFDYYYGAEAEQFSFLKIPKVLLEDKKHFGKLSIGAKLMYAILLDRMNLSRKNTWFDKQNRVYIVFPIHYGKQGNHSGRGNRSIYAQGNRQNA
ncbi:MAG: replication initiator protein A [Oscillospiraceae bacterium]